MTPNKNRKRRPSSITTKQSNKTSFMIFWAKMEMTLLRSKMSLWLKRCFIPLNLCLMQAILICKIKSKYLPLISLYNKGGLDPRRTTLRLQKRRGKQVARKKEITTNQHKLIDKGGRVLINLTTIPSKWLTPTWISAITYLPLNNMAIFLASRTKTRISSK